MGMWQMLEANFKPVAQVNIKCGIYKGDALSLLLFCIGLKPLSEITDKTGYGYQLHNPPVTRYLRCMDDINLYARYGQTNW